MADWDVVERTPLPKATAMPPPEGPPGQRGMFVGDIPPAAGAVARPATPGEVIEPQVERITAERPSAPVPTPKTASPAFNALDWDVVERKPIQRSQKAAAAPQPQAAPARDSTGKETRGVRNNNPGNIISTDNAWQGEVEGKDKRFASFDTPQSGIRALAKQLQIYDDRHGVNTVRSIIKRWAPASDNNNVEAYVAAVTKSMGVEPNAPLDLSDPATLRKATIAIIEHENGGNPYDDATITAGVNAALGIPTPAPAATAVAQRPPQPYREPDILPPTAAPGAKVVQSPAKTPEQAQKFAANQKEIHRIVKEQLNPFGITEVAVEGITNLFAALPGAALGIQQAIAQKDPQKFAEVMDFVREYYTEHPETEGGKRLSAAMQSVMGLFHKLGEWIGDKSVSIDETLDDVAGTQGKTAPLVAAFARTLTEGLPLLLPGLGRSKPKELTAQAPEVVVPGRVEPSATMPREVPPGPPDPAMGAEPSVASLARPGEPTLAPGDVSITLPQQGRTEVGERDGNPHATLLADVEPVQPTAEPPKIDWDRARAAAQAAKRPVQQSLPMDAPAVPRPLELTPPVAPRLPEPIAPEAAPPPEPVAPPPAPEPVAPEPPPAPPEPAAPPLPIKAKRGGVTVEDPRLQTEGTTEALRSMAARAGWDEVGGRLLRDPDGVVIGRTKWRPIEAWYESMQGERRTKMNPHDLRAAVEKVIRGEKVTPQEGRAIKFLLDENDRINESFSKIEDEHGPLIHAQDDVLDSLSVTDLPATHANLVDLALIDKARALDEDAFQRIPEQVSDADFMVAVRKIIDEKSKTQEAAPSEPSTEATSPTAIAEPTRAEPTRAEPEPLTGSSAAVYSPAAPAIKPRARKKSGPLPLPKPRSQ